MIETEHGNFEIVKDHKDAFDIKAFNERYIDYLDKYVYIVGDISAEMLRLKGFSKKEYDNIGDYLMESTSLNTPYYILKRLDPTKVVSEEEKD